MDDVKPEAPVVPALAPPRKLAVVKSLDNDTFRNVPATLREIAKQIEAGEFGDISQAALVLYDGDEEVGGVEVFGMGKGSDGASTHLLFHAGMMKLAESIM